MVDWFRVFFQYGKVKRELCLEQIVRGLCCDINKLEVARVSNEDGLVKTTESSLSWGLQTLAEVMRDHLTFKRECILTAFSLTPNQDLYKKIVMLAQESGFSTAEVKSEESEAAKINFSGKLRVEHEAYNFANRCRWWIYADFLKNAEP